MKPKLQRAILLALNQCDGVPMPEAALLDAVGLMLVCTRQDVWDALKDVEAAGYASGLTDDIAGRSWTLTTKGVHKSRALR